MSKKGGSFERQIAKDLSLWFSDGHEDDLFWRSDASGARAKTRSKKGKRTHGQHGDICSTHPDSEILTRFFVIELKRGYQKWSMLDLVDKKPHAARQVLEKFVEQVKSDQKNSAVPFWSIIARRDQRDPVIIFDSEFVDVFNMLDRLSYIRIKTPELSAYLFNLGEFFRIIKSSEIVEFLSGYNNKI